MRRRREQRAKGFLAGLMLGMLAPVAAEAQGPGSIYAPVGGGFVPFGGPAYGGSLPYRYGSLTTRSTPGRAAGMSPTGRLSTRIDAMGERMRPALGTSRSVLEPLTPLRDMPAAMSGPALSPRASAMGGMPAGGGLRGPARMPVGFYPFRVPPLFNGPSNPMIGM